MYVMINDVLKTWLAPLVQMLVGYFRHKLLNCNMQISAEDGSCWEPGTLYGEDANGLIRRGAKNEVTAAKSRLGTWLRYHWGNLHAAWQVTKNYL